MVTLALAGKPNCGKSTFYKAATMAHAEVGNYPFTTIDANRGVAYVRTPCPCTSLNIQGCTACTDGIRYIPVDLIDVAGLVPDAHAGKGLGNQFLDNIRLADAVINIIDASGSTDIEGNPTDRGSSDPFEEIAMLKTELVMWVYGIIEKHWGKLQRQAQQKSFSMVSGLSEILAGLSIRQDQITDAERECNISLRLASADELLEFTKIVLEKAKPIILAGNKADNASVEQRKKLLSEHIMLTSGEAEFALRSAAAAGLITYHAGDETFSIPDDNTLSEPQKAALGKIGELMRELVGTGVQQTLNHVVFDVLDYIVLYPVEDEHKLCDGQGRILPDAFLMKRGSTPRDLAYRVHTDIGTGFLYAVDAKTNMRIKEQAELKNSDIIKIVSTAK
jgi:ribosome-binding ATPase YchF (GTP1/OBG family)